MQNKNYVQALKRLQRKIQNQADKKTKLWFDNYLQGAIEYRGVKSGQIIRILKEFHREEKLGQWPLAKQLDFASELIRQKKAEDKFAGTIYIQFYLVEAMPLNVLFKRFDILFKEENFFDWSTTDWFATRVLEKLVKIHKEKAVVKIAAWSKRKNFWQRRISVVGLRGASQDSRNHTLIEEVIKRLVVEKERFIQTGIGWLLADMSKVHSDKTASLVEEYFHLLSDEVIRRHTRFLPKYKQYKEQLKQRRLAK